MGEPVGALTDSLGEAIGGLLGAPPHAMTSSAKTERRWTKKAEMMAGRYGINLNQLLEMHDGKIIGEAEVTAFLESTRVSRENEAQDQVPARVADQVEKVLVIVGARGGGAALVLDALARIPSQRAVGILDRDPDLKGQ